MLNIAHCKSMRAILQYMFITLLDDFDALTNLRFIYPLQALTYASHVIVFKFNSNITTLKMTVFFIQRLGVELI